MRRPDILARLPIVFGLAEDEAAASIGIGVTKFRQLVDARRMPRPRKLDGRMIYDVDELRAAFKSLPHDGDASEAEQVWTNLRV
jgi:hypothetical protein